MLTHLSRALKVIQQKCETSLNMDQSTYEEALRSIESYASCICNMIDAEFNSKGGTSTNNGTEQGKTTTKAP